jgi:hypothetical protein
MSDVQIQPSGLVSAGTIAAIGYVGLFASVRGLIPGESLEKFQVLILGAILLLVVYSIALLIEIRIISGDLLR